MATRGDVLIGKLVPDIGVGPDRPVKRRQQTGQTRVDLLRQRTHEQDRADIAVAEFRNEIGEALAMLHGAVHGHVAQAQHHGQSGAADGIHGIDAVLDPADILGKDQVHTGGGKVARLHGEFPGQVIAVNRNSGHAAMGRRHAAGNPGTGLQPVPRFDRDIAGEARIGLRVVLEAHQSQLDGVRPEAVRDDDVASDAKIVLVHGTHDAGRVPHGRCRP